ncbi:hypothetical protein GWI33_021633 [Rhynchophorus ferrugineus]|uniref:Carboxylic ester hydrolase n=1 Tax=Rhynchophorus ferrugineus TaxID=354439 RepID=A0A834IR37_RHYFE|nr:hypothetical protein GWI33_021633 [Rhynchophorus ferrugineus]
MKFYYFIILGFLVHFGVGDLIVEIPDGKIRGIPINTPSGRTFYAWKRIPFAKPPLKDLRFLAPQLPDPWDDILDGTEDAPACLFAVSYDGDPTPTNGNSEDCLYINVYTPFDVSKNASTNLTVMFWIYGGGFVSGSGDFSFTDPTPLLEEDVVVVTFNYRLSAFGFLSTKDEIIPGNAGLKDQLLALKWTKRNIIYFGGNPDDLTVFGESAGAMSSGYHIVSPKSRNLFKAVIMQSGNPLTNYFTIDDPKKIAYDLAKVIDSSITESNTSEEVRSVLQQAPADLVLNVTIDSGYALRPILEEHSEEAFLTQPMYEVVEKGDIARVPIIIGHNSEETCSYVTDLESGQTIANYYQTNPQLLVPNMPLRHGTDPIQIGKEIIEEYTGVSGSFESNLAAFFNWWSDDQFVRSVYKHAILQSNYTPVYMYQFSFYGTRSKNHVKIPGAGKVGHADDVGYIFNISVSPLQTDADFLARKRMVKLWTNFAKTLNPTPGDASSDLLQNVTWEVTTSDNVQFLDIGDDLVMKPSRKIEETKFWDSVWDRYSYRPYYTM